MQNKIESRGNLCTELGPPVDSLVEEASTLIYKHTILFCYQQLVWCDVLVFN